MFLPLYAVLLPCKLTAPSNMSHLRQHTLHIRTSGQAASPRHSSSSRLLDYLLRILCHPEDHHHPLLQWAREALLLKCLILPSPLSTLDNKAPLQAFLHLLVLTDRTICLHQGSLVRHRRLTSLEAEGLLHPSQGHLLDILITGFLLRPTSQDPGVLHHLSTVTTEPNLQW